ncbi:MAG: hypothetical protein AAGA75_24165 [Cyanobacteria bacterium P01_E01_bin.6]
MAKVKTNSTQKFIDKCITLETTVFDPRIEQCTTADDLEKLEEEFEAWGESTPEFWYENIKTFEEWIDQVWEWIDDMREEVIVGL